MKHPVSYGFGCAHEDELAQEAVVAWPEVMATVDRLTAQRDALLEALENARERAQYNPMSPGFSRNTLEQRLQAIAGIATDAIDAVKGEK